MTESTIPAADSGMPNSSDLSRRNVWKPFVAGLVAAAGAIPLANAAAPDPIFALIEQHRAALDYLDLLHKSKDEDHPDIEAANTNELRLLRQIVEIKPQTLAGVTVFAEHIAGYPSLDNYGDECAQAIATIAESLRNILAA